MSTHCFNCPLIATDAATLPEIVIPAFVGIQLLCDLWMPAPRRCGDRHCAGMTYKIRAKRSRFGEKCKICQRICWNTTLFWQKIKIIVDTTKIFVYIAHIVYFFEATVILESVNEISLKQK